MTLGTLRFKRVYLLPKRPKNRNRPSEETGLDLMDMPIGLDWTGWTRDDAVDVYHASDRAAPCERLWTTLGRWREGQRPWRLARLQPTGAAPRAATSTALGMI